MKLNKAIASMKRPRPAQPPSGSACTVPNVGVTISRSNNNVRIRDLDQVYEDILVQGDEMAEFMSALKNATTTMPTVPIKDALVIVTAPFVGNKWS